MLLHEDITQFVIQSFYKVYNNLGYGFLEKVYENAMMIELENCGLICTKQKPISVMYADRIVGNYFADIVVENKVIVELKAGDGSFIEEH